MTGDADPGVAAQTVEYDGIAFAIKRVECHETVLRDGESEPCEKPSVAVRVDPTFGGTYPVCARHSRADMVPLGAVVAAALRDAAGLAYAQAGGAPDKSWDDACSYIGSEIAYLADLA